MRRRRPSNWRPASRLPMPAWASTTSASRTDREDDEHFDKAAGTRSRRPVRHGTFSADRAVWRGDLDEAAVEIWRRLVERNPLSPTDRLNFANFLAAAGRWTESAVGVPQSAGTQSGLSTGTPRFEFAAVLVLQPHTTRRTPRSLKLPEGEPRDSRPCVAAPGAGPRGGGGRRARSAGRTADRARRRPARRTLCVPRHDG